MCNLKEIDRKTLSCRCSYDVHYTNATVEEQLNRQCFSNIFTIDSIKFKRISYVEVYLKDINEEKDILEYLALLNTITNCYIYNKERHSVIFKPINRVHLKVSLTLIRYAWEQDTFDKQPDIVACALKLYNNYKISAIDAICIGHIECRSWGNHKLFSGYEYALINNKNFIEQLNNLEAEPNVISVHGTIDKLITTNLKKYKKLEDIIEYLKLEKKVII